MKEVAHQVVVEPLLEPLTGERMTLRSAHCAKSRDTCAFSICGMKMTTSMHQVSGGSKILVYYYSTTPIVLSSVCGGV